MSIVFGSDVGLDYDSGSILSSISSTLGRLETALGRPAKPIKENVYVDDGFGNVPGTAFVGSKFSNIDDVKKRRITTQKPDATVYIKKRAFSSLKEENDTRFMDQGEKLLLRATKLLFERKCAQISAYESLTKIDNLIDEESELDASSVDNIISSLRTIADFGAAAAQAATDIAVAFYTPGSDVTIEEVADALKKQTMYAESADKAEKLIKSLEKLSSDARKSKVSSLTTWIIDPTTNIDVAQIGRGVGVIELTLVDTISTTLSLERGDLGAITFSIEDPYNLMMINEDDIEVSLSAALRKPDKSVEYSIGGAQALLDEARREESKLKRMRNANNQSEIVFEISPNAGANDKVTGRISSSAETFTKNNFAIVMARLRPEDKLTSGFGGDEQSLVITIFGLLNNYVEAIERLSKVNNEEDSSPNAKYARRNLRLFYLGKHIVQPMDGVHIFMRGRTFQDGDIIGPLSAYMNSMPFVQGFSSDEAASDAILEEEMFQFGLDGIPVEIYRLLRSSSLLRNAGTHVFGGLVSTVTSSYSADSGKYILNVQGENNLKWLDLSPVNFKPSLDQAQGVLEDPLTPLDMNIDEATGLITGNPTLSSENKLRKLFFRDGDHKGEVVDDNTVSSNVRVVGDNAYAERRHAPGMVYKWKQGIIVATRNINLRTAISDGQSDIEKIRRDMGVSITPDPFANLDIADIVSLLVTGVPHNYESFFLNAMSVGTYTPNTSTNNPSSYFSSFFDIHRSMNKALGNFQPYKLINIDRRQMANNAISLQSSLSADNTKIKELQIKIAKIQDIINSSPDGNNDTTINQSILSSVSKVLQAPLDKLKKELDDLKISFAQSIDANKDTGLRVYGNDIIFESAASTKSDDLSREIKKIKIRSNLARIRTQINTKFNTDTNLFIVSDDYDKDVDLQAIAINMAGGEQPIWNSTYKTPLETCTSAASVIDFEFFCDSFGHIQFRPPQYNKTPLSLLLKMISLNNKAGDIMPPFLKSLFQSQTDSLKETRDILNLEIEVLSLLLFNVNDVDVGMARTGLTSEDMFINKASATATIAYDLDTAKQVLNLRNQIASAVGTEFLSEDPETMTKISKEIDELQNPKNINVNVNRVTKIDELIQLKAKQQRIDETITKIENSSLKKQLENYTQGTKDISQFSSDKILETFGNLVEDDYNDFFGPGSSKRYIIMDDQIVSYEFRESDKNVACRVNVTGQEDLLGENPGEIGKIPMMWAGATDFDLWRQYGWVVKDAPNKPFFKDAERQCAPYAMMLLSRQRKDIVRAEVTVIGNEYYQLGDVVYLNSRDLLFYVYAINHRFSYSAGTFLTTLSLRYGHPLGEYIPTPLDAIGKHLIKNQRKFNTTYMSRRTAGTDIGTHAGVVIFKGESTGIDLNSDIGQFNLKELKNTILKANAAMATNPNIMLEVRGYILNESQSEKTKSRIASVKDWLLHPSSGFDASNNLVPLGEDFKKVNITSLDDNPILLSVGDDGVLKDLRVPSEELYNVLETPPDTEGNVSEINVIEIVMIDRG